MGQCSKVLVRLGLKLRKTRDVASFTVRFACVHVAPNVKNPWIRGSTHSTAIESKF